MSDLRLMDFCLSKLMVRASIVNLFPRCFSLANICVALQLKVLYPIHDGEQCHIFLTKFLFMFPFCVVLHCFLVFVLSVHSSQFNLYTTHVHCPYFFILFPIFCVIVLTVSIGLYPIWIAESYSANTLLKFSPSSGTWSIRLNFFVSCSCIGSLSGLIGFCHIC